jgi:hypothetical protein
VALSALEEARVAAQQKVLGQKLTIQALEARGQSLLEQQRQLFLLSAEKDLATIASMKEKEPVAPSPGEWAGLSVTHQEMQRFQLQLSATGLRVTLAMEKAVTGSAVSDGGKPESFSAGPGVEQKFTSAESLYLGLPGIGRFHVETGMKDAAHIKKELISRTALLARDIAQWEQVNPDAGARALEEAFERLRSRYELAEQARLERKALEANARALYRDLDLAHVRMELGSIVADDHLLGMSREALDSAAAEVAAAVTENAARLREARATADSLAVELKAKEAAATAAALTRRELSTRWEAASAALSRARQERKKE